MQTTEEAASAAASEIWDLVSKFLESIGQAKLGASDAHAFTDIIEKHTALRWTDERPTEPGWYWVRRKSGQDRYFLYVVRLRSDGWVQQYGSVRRPTAYGDGWEWCRAHMPVEASANDG